MDHIEEINSELTTFKGEQSILLRTKEGGRVVLTNQVLAAVSAAAAAATATATLSV